MTITATSSSAMLHSRRISSSIVSITLTSCMNRSTKERHSSLIQSVILRNLIEQRHRAHILADIVEPIGDALRRLRLLHLHKHLVAAQPTIEGWALKSLVVSRLQVVEPSL